ncbi:hypothetical protein IFM89_032973 [Coptis chinensis]|uniref:PWWP domain-containing protein n=1 Tax=Coptis chinensis TaxID=261450 RepID=A0A835HNW3_9MAGN|nr:hypothetical protein IFM89_032973 [Coptis chinensis]
MMNISHKRKRGSQEISRVSNSKKRYIVYDDVAEGSASSSDIVWAKANNSNTYWPGSIIKRVNGKLLVSFFDCKTTNWIYDSEIRYFENNYMPIMLDIGGMKLRNAIDCALNEFVNRLTLEYSCACENDGNQGRGGLVKKVFEPIQALAFVCRMAVSPFFDGVDSVGVIKGVAQVNAFRRCVFLKRDWIYRDTMRIEESVGDSEADLGTYMEDERGCSVAQEVEDCEEEEFSEGEGYSEEEEEEEKVVEEFSEEELEQEKVVEEHSEEEEEQEKVVEEFSEEEGEFSNKVDTEPVKSSAIISKEDTKRPIKELSSIERSQVSIEKVSQSLEALAFVHKMDYAEEVSQPLEALAFVHKMDYAEEEEFSEEEKEEEVSAEEPEEEELFDEEEEFSDKVDTELENVGSVICNEDSMKPPGEQYFIGRSHISTKKVFQPLEALTFEEEEEEEFPDKIDSELVKSCSVICNDSKKPLEEEHFIERSHISTKKVFQPLEALTFVHGMTYYEEKKLSEEEEKEEEEFSEEEEPEEEDTFEEEEADVFDKLETELVRSGSLVCKEDSMKLLEEQSYIERSQVSIKKVFQPLETLACVRRLAVCPWADKVDTVAVVEAAAQVIAFRCYVYTKSDWTYQKRMRVYESTDESETNLKSIVLEDEQMCRTQEVRFSYDKEEKNHKPLVEQINRGAVNCKKSRENGLNEILRHLYCLALDPFYSGVKRFGVKYSDSMCQKILSYRELVYQKDLDLVPLNHSSYCNHVAETKKPQKVFGESSISCLSNCSVNVVVKGKIGVANDDRTERVQHNKKAKVEEKRQDVKVSCSRSNGEDVVEPVGRDVVDLLGNTPGHNDEYESIKRQKVSPVDTVIGSLEGSTKTQHRANTTLGYYGSQKSKLSSHVQENHVNINPCDEAGIDGRSVDLNVNCRSSCVLNTFPGETVFEDFIRTQCEDRLGVATIQSALLPNLTSKQSDLHFNVGTEVNSSKKELSLVIESGGSSEGNGRLSQQLAVDISINSEQPNTFYPLNILNTSHSPVVSPAPSRNAQFQSSKTDIKAECFTTLNMMFPKNFKLPSKDDLVKRFRSFGPLDSSETKVYSNMGSAQVVFLHHFDAEAAWHCAKTNKIFTGGADIRFWLGRQGHSRRGTNNIPTPSSFPTTGASISNMKSCIGVSNPQGMKDSTKPHRVKFLSDSKDVPSVPLEPKHGTCTGFGSCKYSKDVGPDISPQMLVLLEKCNDMVSEIKDNLGLQSFYTLLTHNFWETANLDDG